MRTTVLIFLLFCCLTMAFAQRKSEFGLVVKSGTYTFPYQKEQSYFLFSGSGGESGTTTTFQKPGNAYVLGIWKSFRMGSQLRLSGDFLYRYFSHTSKQEIASQTTGNGDVTLTVQGQNFRESSISLPISLYFLPRKNGRTSFRFGMGISQILHAEMEGTNYAFNSLFPLNNSSFTTPLFVAERQEFSPNLTILAGIQYRLNENTSIGLEFNHERRPRGVLFETTGLFSTLRFLEMPGMRSLTVSLSHNLLR